MSSKWKIAIGVISGILGAILLFCLIVIIGCAANGLTFGDQICHWFSSKPAAQSITAVAENAVHIIPKG